MNSDDLTSMLDDPIAPINGSRTPALETVDAALARLPDFKLVTLAQLERPIRDFLVNYLHRGLGMEEELEMLLTNLRRSLLFEVASGAARDDFGLDLLSSLAIFCFIKEYVFWQTPEEDAAVDRLDPRQGPFHVAAIACYRPLHQQRPAYPSLTCGESPAGAYADLLRVQIHEPLEERRLTDEIVSFGSITDKTSIRVREMYEENPYPRWTTPSPLRAGRMGARILVPGCGSGHHAIGIATAHPAASVLGVDLSRASLAYGLRKTREYGIRNLTFLHGDILDLDPNLPQFDYISCVGVLHHMKSPAAGLKALRPLLAEDGVLEIGLYSSVARSDLLLAMKVRDRCGLPATADGVRTLRRLIYSAPHKSPLRMCTRTADFYTTSMCRDLLFHVQEHRFTLQEVDRLLVETGFEVQKLVVAPQVIAKFRQRFPDLDESSIASWSKFEAKYPRAFLGMYVVEARKIRDHP